MAAEDVIAEALWASVDDTGVKGRLYQVDTQYLAAVAVQAIRNLSPDDLAELVGGAVEWGVSVPGKDQVVPLTTKNRPERVHEAWPYMRTPRRVVGPWKETL